MSFEATLHSLSLSLSLFIYIYIYIHIYIYNTYNIHVNTVCTVNSKLKMPRLLFFRDELPVHTLPHAVVALLNVDGNLELVSDLTACVERLIVQGLRVWICGSSSSSSSSW